MRANTVFAVAGPEFSRRISGRCPSIFSIAKKRANSISPDPAGRGRDLRPPSMRKSFACTATMRGPKASKASLKKASWLVARPAEGTRLTGSNMMPRAGEGKASRSLAVSSIDERACVSATGSIPIIAPQDAATGRSRSMLLCRIEKAFLHSGSTGPVSVPTMRHPNRCAARRWASKRERWASLIAGSGWTGFM